MRFFSLILLFILFATQRTLSGDVIEPTESILIYQSGRVLSIGLEDQEIKEIGQFSTDLKILWSEYDEISNRIYMIVEAAPFDIKTGKYLVSVVSLDLVSQKEEILYTGYNIQRLTLSPDGTNLLIYQYKMDDRPTPTGSGSVYNEMGIRPIGAQMCILSIATYMCRFIELGWQANQFKWLNEKEFSVTDGALYLCSMEKLSCKIQIAPPELYTRIAVPASQPNQILIAASLYPSDGTSHFYYFDAINRTKVEIEQLRKEPILNSDGIPVIQDNVEYMDLSSDGDYLIINDWPRAFGVLEISTGTEIMMFQGSRPEWLGESYTFVDITIQDGHTEVYAFDVETGIRTTLYTTDQPFHLIVP
jgi:hypothetical protein